MSAPKRRASSRNGILDAPQSGAARTRFRISIDPRRIGVRRLPGSERARRITLNSLARGARSRSGSFAILGASSGDGRATDGAERERDEHGQRLEREAVDAYVDLL